MYAMLVAEDNDELAVLSLVLQRAGLAVTTERTVEKALTTWSERPADILVVSMMAAEPLQVAREVRQMTIVPLILVLESAEELLHINLLRAGVDLVISRPFSARLLITQVQALVRRAGSVPYLSLPTLTVQDLTLDPSTRTVTADDRPSRRLTHLEFRLLYTLMINRGQVLPTETIVEHVWGYTGDGDRELVRGLISRLRTKIETNPRDPHYIKTVAGIGYIMGSED